MDRKVLGKILIVVSIIGLIFTVSISSFTLITLNNTYENALPLFDKIDAMKGYFNAFDENLDEFDTYLKDIDTDYYMQKLSNIRSFTNTLNSFGLGSLVSGFNEDISKVEIIISSIEELKLNLEFAKRDFSSIKASLLEYEIVKENIINFIGLLRAYLIATTAYGILINGLLLYAGYYILNLNKL